MPEIWTVCICFCSLFFYCLWWNISYTQKRVQCFGFFFMYKHNRFLAPSEEKLHCKPSRHFPFIAPYANTLASLKIKDYFALSNSHSFVFIYILCMYNWILNIIVLHIIGIEFYMDLSKFFISCFFCSVLYLWISILVYISVILCCLLLYVTSLRDYLVPKYY